MYVQAVIESLKSGILEFTKRLHSTELERQRLSATLADKQHVLENKDFDRNKRENQDPGQRKMEKEQNFEIRRTKKDFSEDLEHLKIQLQEAEFQVLLNCW